MACMGCNRARGSIGRGWKGCYEVFVMFIFRFRRVQVSEAAPIWRGSQVLCPSSPVKGT